MNYLTRPIYPFAIDWSRARNKTYTFDPAEVQVGFGRTVFTSLHEDVVQGFSFSLLLPDPATIQAHDAFFDALTGNLAGFWLPAPLAAARLLAVRDARTFDLAPQSLAQTWNTRKDLHLWFAPHAGPPMAGKIQSVAATQAYFGEGDDEVLLDVERVTLTADLPSLPTLETDLFRLHYVRLAEDKEKATYLAEGIREQSLKVVELPAEYAAFETGEQPIYLYHFWADAPANVHWRYTSFAADVISGGARFQRWPITHGSLKTSTRPQDHRLDITATFDHRDFPLADHVFNLFLPLPLSRPVNVQVLETSLAAPDTTTPVFTAQIRSVTDDGTRLTARCDVWGGVLARKSPAAYIQPNCNWTVFDSNLPAPRFDHDGTLLDIRPCGLLRQNWEASGVIASLTDNGRTVTVTLLNPGSAQFPNWREADWFTHGFIETGRGVAFEIRGVLKSEPVSTNQVKLTLNYPLIHALTDAGIQLIPGCDGEAETCRGKFNNFTRFGGFPDVPDSNPVLESPGFNASTGGKK